MIPPACAECGAPLRDDQRYCLRCGARHGEPRVDPLAVLGFAEVAAPERAPERPAPVARRAPSRRLSAALAAVTLALGAAAGAALGPGPAPSIAAAPQRLVALVVPSAAPAPATTGEEPSPPQDDGSSDTPSPDETTSTEDSAPAEDDTDASTTETSTTKTSTTPAAADDEDDSSTPSTTTPAATTTPAHVFLVTLAGTAPPADLAPQGTLLSGYVPAGPSAAANQIALLGGQTPTADCVADLAACVLPAGETSLPDQVRTVNLTWRAYVADPAQRCAATPSANVGVSLFTTLASRPDCATDVVDPATLDADLATKDRTPALSLFGLDGTPDPLHALVAKITASRAYKADGVLVIAGDTPATPGALVLSPRATAGRTVDAATGPVALLRSIDDLLGLDPLGAAAQVTTPALDGVLAPPTATASAASSFPHRSHPKNPTRRSP